VYNESMKIEVDNFKKRKSQRKGLEKELDNLWREAGLERAGHKCEWWGCHKTEHLNAHHIFSRSRRSTRWDLENCLILCSGHHSLNTESAHKDPSFLKKLLGEIPGYSPLRTRGWWEMLYRRANTPQKLDLAMEKLYLQAELKNFLKKS